MTEQNQENAAGDLNPIHALNRLSHVVTAIDNLLDQNPCDRDALPLARRLIYARNTLVVALNLWQGDLTDRLATSRGSFYVYCMMDAERLAFIRRIRPALEFTAEEMRALTLSVLDHLIPLVEQAAEEAVLYATENRQSLIMAKNSLAPGGFPAVVQHKTRPIPVGEGVFTPSGCAISG